MEEDRAKYLKLLGGFIDEKEHEISGLLESFGWTAEHVLEQKEERVACPLDNGHSVKKSSLARHVNRCDLIRQGCPQDELDFQLQMSETPSDDKTIKIDEETLNRVLWDHSVKTGSVYKGRRRLPVSHSDTVVSLTQDERLAVSEYVSDVAREQGWMSSIQSDEMLTHDWEAIVKKGLSMEQQKQPMSYKEQLAAIRDLKRRRQSYRAKNVHITKKTYTEIIREVIANQMMMLGSEEPTPPPPPPQPPLPPPPPPPKAETRERYLPPEPPSGPEEEHSPAKRPREETEEEEPRSKRSKHKHKHKHKRKHKHKHKHRAETDSAPEAASLCSEEVAVKVESKDSDI